MGTKQAQPDRFNMRGGAMVFGFVAEGMATTVTPFIRYGFGVEAFRLNALIAAVIILLAAGDTREPAMLYYFCAWLLAVIAQRLATWRLVRKGWVEHSRYAGYPWLAMKVPFVKKAITAKNCVEPLMCFLIGLALCPLSEGLGGFVMLGCPSLLIQRAIESQVNMNRLRRMHDAAIEQRYLSDLYQGRRDDF